MLKTLRRLVCVIAVVAGLLDAVGYAQWLPGVDAGPNFIYPKQRCAFPRLPKSRC